MQRLAKITGLSAIFAVASLVPAQAQSLDEALALAYQNNPTIEAGRAALRAIDEGVPQALSGWRPDVRINGEASRLHQSSNRIAALSDDDRNTFRGSLTVTQNVYAGGQTEAEIRQAKHLVSAQRARLFATEQLVLLDGVTAYMNVFREEAVLELNVGNEQVLSRQLEATQDRFDVGEVTRTDVAQAEAALARAKAVRIKAEGDLEVSRAFYRQIVGVLPVAVPLPDFAPGTPASAEEAAAMAAEKNPEVISVLFAERAAREFADQVKGELLPSVDIVGEAAQGRNTGARGQNVDNLTITAELTVPIYQRGEVSSRIREAIQLAGQRRLEIEEARRSAIEEAASAFELFNSARASILSRDAEVSAARIAQEGVAQEAAVGSRTVLDVLDAEQALLDAQVNLVRDQRDAIVASYALLAAVGGMTAANLALPVDLYDETKYYRQVRDKLWGYD
ncbi:MAG: TolC family outer membrane protein [Alphaproteobacteria bacterium]